MEFMEVRTFVCFILQRNNCWKTDRCYQKTFSKLVGFSLFQKIEEGRIILNSLNEASLTKTRQRYYKKKMIDQHL